jgi:hypothetical protein
MVDVILGERDDLAKSLQKRYTITHGFQWEQNTLAVARHDSQSVFTQVHLDCELLSRQYHFLFSRRRQYIDNLEQLGHSDAARVDAHGKRAFLGHAS